MHEKSWLPDHNQGQRWQKIKHNNTNKVVESMLNTIDAEDLIYESIEE